MKRTVSAAVLGAVVLGCALLGAPAPAAARACTTSQITVVVQYPDNSIRIGCAADTSGTGYDALVSAGFKPSYATGSGSGAICGIDGKPRTSCPMMPPANAYWAYFVGTPGKGWLYSDLGGGSSSPRPGTVEGWRFQSTSRSTEPSIPPPASVSPPVKPTKSPSAKPTRRPSTDRSDAPDPTTTPTVPPTATAGVSPTPSASDLPATPEATATDLTSATAEVPADALAPSSEPAGQKSSGGLSWGWGLGLLGVLAAAGGGAVVLRRRG